MFVLFLICGAAYVQLTASPVGFHALQVRIEPGWAVLVQYHLITWCPYSWMHVCLDSCWE
jgi:hypothetical protein